MSILSSNFRDFSLKSLGSFNSINTKKKKKKNS